MEHPKHIDKQTPDGAQINLDALYKIAPSCFTEAKDEDGNIRKVVDFTKLRLLLGDDTVEDAPEVYDFTWVGKRAALHEAAAPIRKTLRPYKEESVDWDTTQNLYIEGDNLEVLKLLQNSYMGKVKMIYIDPPYNTGNDFVYHDNFFDDDYDKHNFNEEGERLYSRTQFDIVDKLKKNTDSNGRFHSDWCSMIYSRLMVARSLLTEDGVVFISIDDNEVANLKKICDEVFGTTNFIAKFDWRKKTGANDAKDIAIVTESVLLYSKCQEFTITNKIWRRDENSIDTSRYKFEDEFVEERGKFYYDTLDRGGLQYSDSMNFGIEAPDGGIIFPNGRDEFINDGWIWKWGKEKVKWGIENKFLEFVKSNKSKGSSYTIKYKVYQNVDNEGNVREKAGRAFMNLITEPINQIGNSEMKEVFDGHTPFSNPKPTGLIRYLFNTINSNSSIILDFFSGSCTTAHSVMQLNAEDGGNRKFIMVQLPEATEGKSEAYKAGYKNICEIGKERIRRAGKKIKEESPLTTQDLDIGFRVFKCEDSNYKEVAFAPKEYTQGMLTDMIDNIKRDRNDLDLLFDCMLRWGVELSLPLSTSKVDGCTIHNVNDGDLVGCFEGVVTEAVIAAIAAMNPVRVVFRDSSFTEAANKMNLFELFKQKCSWTDEEVKKNIRVI